MLFYLLGLTLRLGCPRYFCLRFISRSTVNKYNTLYSCCYSANLTNPHRIDYSDFRLESAPLMRHYLGAEQQTRNRFFNALAAQSGCNTYLGRGGKTWGLWRLPVTMEALRQRKTTSCKSSPHRKNFWKQISMTKHIAEVTSYLL